MTDAESEALLEIPNGEIGVSPVRAIANAPFVAWMTAWVRFGDAIYGTFFRFSVAQEKYLGSERLRAEALRIAEKRFSPENRERYRLRSFDQIVEIFDDETFVGMTPDWMSE